MAIISAGRSVNPEASFLELSTLDENNDSYVDSVFYDDEFVEFRGTTYEDVIYVVTEVDGSSYLWAFGGTKFKFNDDGAVTGGTVLSIGIFDYDNDADEIIGTVLLVGDIRTPLKSLAAAVYTETTDDDDAVWGRIFSGNDEVSGSDEDDILFGLAGNDLIDGNGGDDRLIGHEGRDTLTGGEGSDTFVFNMRPGKKNIDTITDFDPGHDLLGIEVGTFQVWDEGVFRRLDEGTLAANQFVTGSDALDSNDYFIYRNGTLFFDADGSGRGKAVAVVTLTGAPTLTHNDIYLYD